MLNFLVQSFLVWCDPPHGFSCNVMWKTRAMRVCLGITAGPLERIFLSPFTKESREVGQQYVNCHFVEGLQRPISPPSETHELVNKDGPSCVCSLFAWVWSRMPVMQVQGCTVQNVRGAVSALVENAEAVPTPRLLCCLQPSQKWGG